MLLRGYFGCRDWRRWSAAASICAAGRSIIEIALASYVAKKRVRMVTGERLRKRHVPKPPTAGLGKRCKKT